MTIQVLENVKDLELDKEKFIIIVNLSKTQPVNIMKKDLPPLKSTMYRNVKIEKAEKLLLINFKSEKFSAEAC